MNRLGDWLCAHDHHCWRWESRVYPAQTVQPNDGLPTNPFELIRQVRACKRCGAFADPADVPGSFMLDDE